MAEKQQQLTLGYWDLRGLGQAIRLLLKYVQADFENKEYTEPDAWFANKFALGFDFPNLPYLIDGDVKLTQSGAILRYLGRKHGLVAKTPEDELKLDMFEMQVVDYRSAYTTMCFTPPDAFEEKKKSFFEVQLPHHAKMLDKFLEGKKFALGDYLTFADFAFYEATDRVLVMDPNAFAAYKNISAHHAAIEALPVPALQEYIKWVHETKYPMFAPRATFK